MPMLNVFRREGNVVRAISNRRLAPSMNVT
jgi:hypothetical protein